MTGGCLWLVPNSLDHGAEPVDLQDVLPLGVLRRAAELGHWVAEDARSALEAMASVRLPITPSRCARREVRARS